MPTKTHNIITEINRDALPVRFGRFFYIFPLVAVLVSIAVATRAQSSDTNDVLASWLSAQTNIQTWSADFVQTRTLKSLTQPLTASGHVWFEAPNRFHWEIKIPTETLAVRQTDQILVIYPKLKRAERYPLNTKDAGPWKDTLALLDAGFPRSRAEVDSKFVILSQTATNGIHELALQPKSENARRLIPQIKIAFETSTLLLHSTELQLADGSTMANVFTNAVLNPKIDEAVFNPNLEGYKITQPFKK
ncbi:MAG: LolA family protein [Pedosphaera sp.]|nr:LolA family protein [Pedosphaera sp.]